MLLNSCSLLSKFDVTKLMCKLGVHLSLFFAWIVLPYSISHRNKSEMVQYVSIGLLFFFFFCHFCRVIPSAQNETKVIPATQYKTIHIYYTYIYRIATDIEIQQCYSILSSAFGHKFSSTSHLMSSLAIHLGKNLFACLIHPWQSSAGMSRHPAFIASKKDPWSCGGCS